MAPSTSLVLRWWIDLRFTERGWAGQAAYTDAIAAAIEATATAARLDRVSIGGGVARPRDGALAAALTSGKARYALLTGGKNTSDDATPAWIEIEISPRSVMILAMVGGPVLAALKAAALDDFFAITRALHDALGDKAHLIEATAASQADEHTPDPRMSSDWPLRRIADVLEPARPARDDDDVVLTAAQAIADADAPPAATRTTHGGLVELRWLDDPSDASAADAAGLAHEAWMTGFVKHEPLT